MARKKIYVECALCGEKKHTTPSQVKKNTTGYFFCNKKHMELWRDQNPYAFAKEKTKVTVHCTNCKKNKDVYRSHYNKHPKRFFCNLTCRDEWQRKKGRATVKCAQCGTSIQKHNYIVEQNKTGLFFCDKRCRGLHKRNQIEVTCSYCGNPKNIDPSAFKVNKTDLFFCNNSCRGAWQSENNTGDNNPNWAGGSWGYYYGPNWKQQRKKALKRDGYKCKNCGASNTKAILHVHHLTPFKNFGYIPGSNDFYEAANDQVNLVTLCNVCHRKAESGVIPIQPYLL